MADSILTQTKKLLGIAPEYDAFDLDIQIHINSAFAELTQIGAAPLDGFVITGPDETWQDLYNDEKQLEMIRTFVYLRVRLLFDPPATSFAIEAMERQLDMLTFRLNILEFIFNPDVLVNPETDISETNFKILQDQINAESATRESTDADILALINSTGGGTTALVGEWQLSLTPGAPIKKQQLSCDTGTFGTATSLFFKKVDLTNADMTPVIQLATVIYAQLKSDSTNWIRYSVDGAMIDHGDYVEVPVLYVTSAGEVPTPQWQTVRAVFIR